MHHLTHEEQSRQLILIGLLSKILLEISPFLRGIVNYKVRDDRQVEVAVIHESSLPAYQPYTVSVEENVFRPQVVVRRHHIRIRARVNGRHLRKLTEGFIDFVAGEKTRRPKPPDESVVHRDVIERFGKRR